ncbi:MAG: hypothetical protein ACLQDA_09125 [Terracidiphilus sp.]
MGSYHKISIKHLSRYLAEFQFRFGERRNTQRFETMVSKTARTSPLPYRTLVGNPDLGPF